MSKSRKGISLPDLSFLSFDPISEETDKKKAAPGEAGRPIGEAMLSNTTERLRAPQANPSIAKIIGRGDGLDRAHAHAAEWFRQQTARGQGEIFSAEFTITPQMAALLLKRNPDNRHLKKTRIAEIRSDLESGRYVLNGEPIIVSKDGLLNDGQHRLIACVESGVTFRSLVVFGVSRSSRTTLDQGIARTTADYLNMQGDTGNTKVIAAVARMLWQYNTNRTLSTGGGKSSRWPTKAQILITAAEHEREIARNVQAVNKSSRFAGSLSLVIFCRLLLERADATMGPIFIDRLLDGSNLKPQSPIYILRERLINDPKIRPAERLEAVIRAWNAMRKGVEIKKIQIMGAVPKIEV